MLAFCAMHISDREHLLPSGGARREQRADERLALQARVAAGAAQLAAARRRVEALLSGRPDPGEPLYSPDRPEALGSPEAPGGGADLGASRGGAGPPRDVMPQRIEFGSPAAPGGGGAGRGVAGAGERALEATLRLMITEVGERRSANGPKCQQCARHPRRAPSPPCPPAPWRS
jgi:hypothetical protein